MLASSSNLSMGAVNERGSGFLFSFAKLFLGAFLAVLLAPVLAYAAPSATDNAIPITDKAISGPHSVASGQEIVFSFEVPTPSRVAFAFDQFNSLASGPSLHAKLQDSAGVVHYEWDVARDVANVILGDFIVDSGTHFICMKANCDVSNIQIKLNYDDLGSGFNHEVEPNGGIASATPIAVGKSYVGSIYDPSQEYFILGNMVGINDVDMFSFQLDSTSDVNLSLWTPGVINYEVTANPSATSLKVGNTGSGDTSSKVSLGTLSPGKYYLVLRGADTVWGMEYVFQVDATTISVDPYKISKIELSQTEYVYSGDYYEPLVTVWAGNKVIARDLAYLDSTADVATIMGNSKKNAGTYTVTVKGRGQYTGSASASFTIKPCPITRIVLGKTQFDYSEYYAPVQVPWNVTVYAGTERVCYLYPDRPESGEAIATFPKDSKYPGRYTVTVKGLGNYTGTLSATYTIGSVGSSDGTQQMYRLYNPNSGEHFYTANAGEKDNLVKVGWSYEGIGWNAPAKSKSPVYRLYNANAGDHHYTMSAAERDMLVGVGWSYEGIGWYSDDAKGVALYRQYNPNALAGSHNYTTSQAEHNQLVSIGWQGEGVGWYGCK